MTTLQIGTNRIENCEQALAIGGVSLFSVNVLEGRPRISLELRSPPATAEILIDENSVVSGDASVQQQRSATEVRYRGQILLSVTLSNPDELVVDLDLRGVGLNIYTERTALRIGGATLSGNVFRGCRVAIKVAA